MDGILIKNQQAKIAELEKKVAEYEGVLKGIWALGITADTVSDSLICPHCLRNEKECEEETESEKNPITEWMGGWGLSCDDCYYKNHPETEDEESGEE